MLSIIITYNIVIYCLVYIIYKGIGLHYSLIPIWRVVRRVQVGAPHCSLAFPARHDSPRQCCHKFPHVSIHLCILIHNATNIL